MQILLQTLGCRLNEAELEQWSRQFGERGHQVTTRLDMADLVVVNTCAVTGEAVRKSRKLLNRVHQKNPRAKLVVSGCYASLESRACQEQGVDLVVENRDKEQLVEIACRELELPSMPAAATLPDADTLLTRGRQRAFIKVQDGCRYQCTFCIVTRARGEERSRQIDEVITEVRQLREQGLQEVVLSGVHLGGYGSDLDSDLGHLVEAILEQTDLPRLRLGALEPWDLSEHFWRQFDNPRLMPHLHLPLQSGSDLILKRMARRCKADEYRRMVERALQANSDFNITTDIIVGFPGEGEAEWQQTCDMAAEVGFSHMHIFTYSPRPGTRAMELPDPVEATVARERSQQLHQLGEQMKRQFLSRFEGRVMDVLVEGDKESRGGYTPNFLRVELAANEQSPINEIIRVRLQQPTEGGDRLMATPET